MIDNKTYSYTLESVAAEKNLIIFALSGCLGFLLAANGRFLVMLALSDLLLDSGLRTASFESAQSAVQSFILFYDDT